jgi:Ankyrin repeats (3 copies)
MRSAFQAAIIFLATSLFQVGAHAAAVDNLFTAVTSKDLTALAAMVDRGADVNARNDAGQTPLMLAATQHGSEKLIEQLVFQGADIRARDKNGMTALMHAAGKGEEQNAEQLLQLGVDPDIKDNSGKTLTDYAKAGGLDVEIGNRPPFAAVLMEKSPANEKTAYTFYIAYKPGTLSAKEFEQAATRALTRKNWGITELNGTTAQAFYARVKQRQLYKVEVIQEPTRIAIRFRPGFGSLNERAYLEHIRLGLMHELALY